MKARYNFSSNEKREPSPKLRRALAQIAALSPEDLIGIVTECPIERVGPWTVSATGSGHDFSGHYLDLRVRPTDRDATPWAVSSERLVEAAPEMFAALWKVHRALMQDLEEFGLSSRMDEAMDAVIDALDKAEGES